MQVDREDEKPQIYKCAIRCSPLYIFHTHNFVGLREFEHVAHQ